MARLARFALVSALVAALPAIYAAGCQSNPANGGSSGSGGSGDGGDDTSTSTSGEGGGTSSTSAGEGGGATSPCEGVDATIEEVTTGAVGPGVKVKLTGVVAMSQKFLVSKGSSSNSCLWGMFVSAPGLSETAANTGILVLDYGFNATADDGGADTYCPMLGREDTGDDLPDDVKPGDELTIIGETGNFLLSNCADEPNGASVGQFQITKACGAEKTGTQPVPAAHVMTGEQLAQLASPSDKAFHDAWGGVKIRVEDVTATPGPEGGAVGDFGVIKLEDSGLEVGDKIYYRGYLKNDTICHEGPHFDQTLKFTAIEGISYLSFCTWGIQPNDKCADFAPSSEDCGGQTTCPPYTGN
jgi:hypothetical protein